MKLNLSLLSWYVTYYAKKLGLWGWLGLVLMLMSYIVHQAEVKTVRTSTEQLVTQKVLAEAQSGNQPLQTETPEALESHSNDIEDFYNRFPNVEALPAVLETMNQLAAKQGIVLNSGDYKLDKLKKSNSMPKTLTKYQISFPVLGDYKKIRRFTANVLNKLPGVALTDMQVKRENTTDQQVEASLVYVLFVKGKQW